MQKQSDAERLTVAALALNGLMGGGRAVYESVAAGTLLTADVLTALAYAGIVVLLVQRRWTAGLVVSLTLCGGWLLVNLVSAEAPIALWRGWSISYAGLPILSLVAAVLITGDRLQRRGE